MLATVAAGVWVGVMIWTWPSVGRLATARPATTAFIEQYRAEQRAAGRPTRVAWTWTPYAAISPALKRAVLVSEDVNFFSHHGFALDEMQSALEDALRDRELPRGASTITQQLAKNLWLSRSRNPLRKAKEYGFSDRRIARLLTTTEDAVRAAHIKIAERNRSRSLTFAQKLRRNEEPGKHEEDARAEVPI